MRATQYLAPPPPPVVRDGFYSIEDLVRLHGLHRKRLTEACRSGKLRHLVCGSTRRVLGEWLLEWMWAESEPRAAGGAS